MKKVSLITSLFISMSFSACTGQSANDNDNERPDQGEITRHMKNLISIVELPVVDMRRAVVFYQTILGIRIEEVDMGDTRMGILPNEDGTVNVVLVHGEGYLPSTDGTVAYLAVEDDLHVVLDRVAANGGQVLVPKTEISPEVGFFAHFADSEGNKLGLHSPH